MESREIKWLTGPDKPTVYLSQLVHYALVSDEWGQCHPFVSCRGYLSDIVFAAVNKTETIDLDGLFYYFNTSPKPSFSELRLMVAEQRAAVPLNESLQLVLNVIHNVEKDLDIYPLMRILKVQNPLPSYEKRGIFLLIGCRDWIISPVMLSLCTFLLREYSLFLKNDNWRMVLKELVNDIILPVYRPDAQHLKKGGMAGIERLIKEKPKYIFSNEIEKNYPNCSSRQCTHSEFGLTSFGSGRSGRHCPHWYRLPKKKII